MNFRSYNRKHTATLAIKDRTERKIAQAQNELDFNLHMEEVVERYSSMLISAYQREGQRVRRSTRGLRLLEAILPAARRHARHGQQLKAKLEKNNQLIQQLRENAQLYAHSLVKLEQQQAEHQRRIESIFEYCSVQHPEFGSLFYEVIDGVPYSAPSDYFYLDLGRLEDVAELLPKEINLDPAILQ